MPGAIPANAICRYKCRLTNSAQCTRWAIQNRGRIASIEMHGKVQIPVLFDV